MTTEEIYKPPKSKVRDEPKPFPPIKKFTPVPNIILAVAVASILGYLAVYMRYTNQNYDLMVSPFFGGLLFPISALISIIIIAYTGNREKLTSENGISFGHLWFLLWRCYVVNFGAIIITALITQILRMDINSRLVLLLAIFWVFSTPLCSWLFFAKNKKQHLFWLSQQIRGN